MISQKRIWRDVAGIKNNRIAVKKKKKRLKLVLSN